MKKLLVLGVLSLMFTGCGAVERTGDFLFAPNKSQAAVELESKLQPDRASWQAILDNPKASKADKFLAQKAVQSIDGAVKAAEQSQPGDSNLTFLLKILASFGVPGTAAGAVGSVMFGRWYAQAKKANVQTVVGIEQAKKDNPDLERTLNNALSKTQDQDVKALIAKIKSEEVPEPTT